MKLFQKMNSIEAQCSLCLNKVRHSSNTTNLRNHMNRNHPRVELVNLNKIKPHNLVRTTTNVDEEVEDDPTPLTFPDSQSASSVTVSDNF